MKKYFVLLVSALLLLSGCGTGGAKEKTLKIGNGVYTTVATTDATDEAVGTVAVNTTFAWLAVDANDTIVYVKFDTVQNNKATFDKTGAIVDSVVKVSKGQLLEDYGMKGRSPIEKEWYEQVQFMETWMTGKKVADVLATEIADGYPTDADLLTGTTIHITDFIAALQDANEKLVEVKGVKSIGADSYTTGSFTAATAEANGKIGFNSDSALVALDADNKVVYSYSDSVQTSVAFTAEGAVVTATSASKKALGDEYGMKGRSQIGKEWFEQMAAFEAWTVGKTMDEVVGIELVEGVPTDADILTGTTIRMTNTIAALVAANAAVVALD